MSISVLICDDSNIARKQLKKALPEQWKESALLVNNGEEALEALQMGNFDLLFLDLTMPVMDGFQVLAAIKEQGIQVKTIVVSADLQIEARNKVAADGAIDFIRKPVSASALLDALNTHGLL